MTDTGRTIGRDANAIHLTPIGHILPISISRGWLAHLNPEIIHVHVADKRTIERAKLIN